MRGTLLTITLATLALLPASAEKEHRLSQEDRIALLRGLTAEYATAKVLIPRSKKPLPYPADGKYDKAAWESAAQEMGPAARAGELVQITKVNIEDNRIELELNHGVKSGRKWYERVEVGVGGSTAPINRTDAVSSAGSNIAVLFGKRIEALDPGDLKKMLQPILDFDKHSVTENYMDSLPEPVQAAIKEKRVIEGMNMEQVIMAVGRPVRKERKNVEGVDIEDWVYGQPPGKISFITFTGSKVSKVKDAYAGLGGSVAPSLPVQ